MTTETWLLYVTTTLVFMSTPGPSHLLMLSTSMANGFRRSLATAAGDLTANALQMLAAGLGLAALMELASLDVKGLKDPPFVPDPRPDLSGEEEIWPRLRRRDRDCSRGSHR